MSRQANGMIADESDRFGNLHLPIGCAQGTKLCEAVDLNMLQEHVLDDGHIPTRTGDPHDVNVVL